MAGLYADLVKRGLWELNQVPQPWHDAVAAILARQSDTGGNMST